MDELAQPGRPPARPEDMRAGDADREHVLDRLRTAHAEGRLDVHEFDERVMATLAARTYGELAELTVDLPGHGPTGPPADASPALGRRAVGEAAARNSSFRQGVQAWAGVSAVTVVIWGISCIASASLIFPWWLWVTGPWGAVLLVAWLGRRTQAR